MSESPSASLTQPPVVVPDRIPPDAPYANFHFTVVSVAGDATICFMRIPGLNEEEFSKMVESGRYAAQVVAAVTLPLYVVENLGKALTDLTVQLQQRASSPPSVPSESPRGVS